MSHETHKAMTSANGAANEAKTAVRHDTAGAKTPFMGRHARPSLRFFKAAGLALSVGAAGFHGEMASVASAVEYTVSTQAELDALPINAAGNLTGAADVVVKFVLPAGATTGAFTLQSVNSTGGMVGTFDVAEGVTVTVEQNINAAEGLIANPYPDPPERPTDYVDTAKRFSKLGGGVLVVKGEWRAYLGGGVMEVYSPSFANSQKTWNSSYQRYNNYWLQVDPGAVFINKSGVPLFNSSSLSILVHGTFDMNGADAYPAGLVGKPTGRIINSDETKYTLLGLTKGSQRDAVDFKGVLGGEIRDGVLYGSKLNIKGSTGGTQPGRQDDDLFLLGSENLPVQGTYTGYTQIMTTVDREATIAGAATLGYTSGLYLESSQLVNLNASGQNVSLSKLFGAVNGGTSRLIANVGKLTIGTFRGAEADWPLIPSAEEPENLSKATKLALPADAGITTGVKMDGTAVSNGQLQITTENLELAAGAKLVFSLRDADTTNPRLSGMQNLEIGRDVTLAVRDTEALSGRNTYILLKSGNQVKFDGTGIRLGAYDTENLRPLETKNVAPIVRIKEEDGTSGPLTVGHFQWSDDATELQYVMTDGTVVEGNTTLTWRGTADASGSVWKHEPKMLAFPNWAGHVGAAPAGQDVTTFINEDDVIFDESGLAGGNVRIDGVVKPKSVVVSAGGYSFGGNGLASSADMEVTGTIRATHTAGDVTFSALQSLKAGALTLDSALDATGASPAGGVGAIRVAGVGVFGISGALRVQNGLLELLGGENAPLAGTVGAGSSVGGGVSAATLRVGAGATLDALCANSTDGAAFRIGDASNTAANVATVEIVDGSQFTIRSASGAGRLYVGEDATAGNGHGVLRVSGFGSLATSTGELRVGNLTGHGLVEVLAGGELRAASTGGAASALLGAGGEGVVTVSGVATPPQSPAAQASRFYVAGNLDVATAGAGARGTLNVAEGGVVEIAGKLTAGQDTGAATAGISVATGGTISVGGIFNIGDSTGANSTDVSGAGSRITATALAGALANNGASGSLSIRGGATVFAGDAWLAVARPGTFSVLITGEGSALELGSGENSDTLSGGGNRERATAAGALAVPAPGSLVLGAEGAASLTVANGGRLSTGAQGVVVIGSPFASTSGSSSSLNIGAPQGESPAAPGLVVTNAIRGEGTLQFNHTLDGANGTAKFYLTRDGLPDGLPIQLGGVLDTGSVAVGSNVSPYKRLNNITLLQNSGHTVIVGENPDYSGPVIVNGGVLEAVKSSSLGKGAITVNGGRLLFSEMLLVGNTHGSRTIENTTGSAGAISFAPGKGVVIDLNAGRSLNLPSLTLEGASSFVDEGHFVAPLDLLLGMDGDFNITTQNAPGGYALMKIGGLTAAPANFTVNGRVVPTPQRPYRVNDAYSGATTRNAPRLDISEGMVKLFIENSTVYAKGASTDLQWAGTTASGGNLWKNESGAAVAANWEGTITTPGANFGLPVSTFCDGDSVTFSTPAAPRSVLVADEGVAPAAVLVNNNGAAGSYTILGGDGTTPDGGIRDHDPQAPTVLTKSGTGLLVLAGKHSFSGGIVVENGTLEAADDASLGAAHDATNAPAAFVTLGSGGSKGTFRLPDAASPADFSSRPFVAAGAGARFDTNGGEAQVHSFGGGAVEKTGAGALTVLGASTNTSYLVSEGILRLRGTAGGAVDVAAGAVLEADAALTGLVTLAGPEIAGGAILAGGTLAGTARVPSLTAAAGAILSPGGADGRFGTLTLGDAAHDIALNGVTFKFDIKGGASSPGDVENDAIVIDGTLRYAGTNIFDVTAYDTTGRLLERAWVAGVYPVIQAAAFADSNAVLDGHLAATKFFYRGIELNATQRSWACLERDTATPGVLHLRTVDNAAMQLFWAETGDRVWGREGTENPGLWNNSATPPSPFAFLNGDFVTFANQDAGGAPVSKNVVVSRVGGGVAVGQMRVTGEDFVFSGGKILGVTTASEGLLNQDPGLLEVADGASATFASELDFVSARIAGRAVFSGRVLVDSPLLASGSAARVTFANASTLATSAPALLAADGLSPQSVHLDGGASLVFDWAAGGSLADGFFMGGAEGDGSITKLGDGRVVLGGTASVGGNIHVGTASTPGGTLGFSTAAAFAGAAEVRVFPGGTLELLFEGVQAVAGDITGGGGVLVSAGEAVFTTAAKTYSGPTDVIPADDAAGATLRLALADSLPNSSGVRVSGAGTLVLAQAGALRAATPVEIRSGGMLRLQAAQRFDALSIEVSAGGVDFGGNTVTLSGSSIARQITGAASIIIAPGPDGALKPVYLQAVDALAGAVVSALPGAALEGMADQSFSRLEAAQGSSIRLNTSTLTIAGGTIAGALTGASTSRLILQGEDASATFALTGTASHGATILRQGTLRVASDASLGRGLNTLDGGVLAPDPATFAKAWRVSPNGGTILVPQGGVTLAGVSGAEGAVLVKLGDGLLTIGGTPPTLDVAAGALRLAGDTTGAITLRAGATRLDLNGHSAGGDVIIPEGGVLAGGGAIAGGLTLGRGAVLDGVAGAPVAVAGAIVPQGEVSVRVASGAITSGHTVLATYGTLDLSAGSLTLGLVVPQTDSRIRLEIGGGEISLDGRKSLVWGATTPNAVWEVRGADPWLESGAQAGAEKFYQFDAVRFDDTAPQRSVFLSDAKELHVSRLEIASSAGRDYVFNGRASIHGALVKSGAGAARFTGEVALDSTAAITGGLLQTAAGARLSAPLFDIGADGAIGGSGVFAGDVSLAGKLVVGDTHGAGQAAPARLGIEGVIAFADGASILLDTFGAGLADSILGTTFTADTGATVFVDLTAVDEGVYSLATFSEGLTGVPSANSIFKARVGGQDAPEGMSLRFSYGGAGGGELLLTVAPATHDHNLSWTGGTETRWDATSPRWADSSGAAVAFQPGDIANFQTEAPLQVVLDGPTQVGALNVAGAGHLTLIAPPAPASAALRAAADGSATPPLLSGVRDNSVTGATGRLEKNGTASLILRGTESAPFTAAFPAGVSVNSGNLILDNSRLSAPVTVKSGAQLSIGALERGGVVEGGVVVERGGTLALGTTEGASGTVTGGIRNEGLLEGTGVIEGGLVNAGTFRPRDVLIRGGTLANAGGVIELSLSAATGATNVIRYAHVIDSILDGKLSIAIPESWLEEGNRRFTVALLNEDSGKLVPGAPGALEILAFNDSTGEQVRLRQNFGNSDEGLELRIGRDVAEVPGLGESLGGAFATVLEDLDATGRLGTLDPVLTRLLDEGGGDAAAEVRRLSPLGFSAMTAMAITSANESSEALRGRLASLRRQKTSAATGDPAARERAGGGENTGKTALSAPYGLLSTYVLAAGNHVANGKGTNNPAFDTQTYGGAVGLDYEAANGAVFGVSLAGNTGTAMLHDSGGKIRQGQFLATAYAGISFLRKFHLDASVFGGLSDYDIRRSVAGGSTRGDVNGFQAGASLYAGATQSLVSTLSAEPFAGVDFVHAEVNSFTESGQAALTSNWFEQNSLRLRAGATLVWEPSKSPARLMLTLAYAREMADENVSLRSRFAAFPEMNKFGVSAPSISGDSLQIAPAAEFAIGNEATFSVGYSFSTDFRDSTAHGFNATFRVRF
jgi:autotransporter-associated beta strand protein